MARKDTKGKSQDWCNKVAPRNLWSRQHKKVLSSRVKNQLQRWRYTRLWSIDRSVDQGRRVKWKLLSIEQNYSEFLVLGRSPLLGEELFVQSSYFFLSHLTDIDLTYPCLAHEKVLMLSVTCQRQESLVVWSSLSLDVWQAWTTTTAV